MIALPSGTVSSGTWGDLDTWPTEVKVKNGSKIENADPSPLNKRRREAETVADTEGLWKVTTVQSAWTVQAQVLISLETCVFSVFQLVRGFI